MTGDRDRWARWLLHDRFAGDEAALERMLRQLEPIRDRVLDAARIRDGDTVLDVGAGDGLIGFGALERSEPDGVTLFCDVSAELLDTCREIARSLDVTDRCRFIQTRAEHLDGIPDANVDAVVLRSVLIYVEDKAAAFDAFHRVLRPGGRLSLFEPINRTMQRLNSGTVFGYDARSIRDLVERIRGGFNEAVGGDSGPMLGFDEVDLVRAADQAGFVKVDAEVRIVQRSKARLGPTDWETFLAQRPNPLAPTVGEAIAASLSENEVARLREHLEPQVREGTGRSFLVGCFLDAERPG
ncbi:MAG: methyltransferase domain-containing protein [Nitriliruptorales bacterium]|nr:methyltransferase domain-containing protein [Nitriliruptorales bacterium]